MGHFVTKWNENWAYLWWPVSLDMNALPSYHVSSEFFLHMRVVPRLLNQTPLTVYFLSLSKTSPRFLYCVKIKRFYRQRLKILFCFWQYCLTEEPEKRAFEPEKTAAQSYPITKYQPIYFVADSFQSAKEKVRWESVVENVSLFVPLCVSFFPPYSRKKTPSGRGWGSCSGLRLETRPSHDIAGFF